MSELCHAGKQCGFGGKWRTPCESFAIHAIANPGSPPILLCDTHFQEVFEAGLVTEPNVGEEEFKRREQERQQ
jgi:hypothetical protein